MKNSKILIVDDNRSILSALEMLLHPLCKKLVTTTSPNRINSLMREHNFDVILLDMNFTSGTITGNEGIFWLNQIISSYKECSVIMITAYGDVELAVKAVKQGAVDFIIKPWDNNKLIATINAAINLTKSRKEVSELKLKEKSLKSQINHKTKNIIGSSPALMNTLKIVKKVAKTNANVLITGENGTGKELIAQELYRLSNRANEVFVNVDMGAVSETLFESELFGHVKGAYTDAHDDRIGKIELASGGTLFLDEIANLTLSLQAKLLSALQNREIIRLGSNKVIPVDIRLICATNGDLHSLVKQGVFREDLLYRINTIQIEIPPLRERKEDISLLCDFFLKRYATKYGKKTPRLTANALKKLEKHNWPGNIRELQHTIEKAVILSDDDVLKNEDFLFKNYKTNKKKEIKANETLEEKKTIIT